MVEDEQRRPDDAPAPRDAPDESVARGRASGTPFALLGGVAVVIWAIVVAIAAILLVVWWLV